MKGTLRIPARTERYARIAAMLALLTVAVTGHTVEYRPKAAATDSLTALSLGVTALETLYALDLTAEQLHALRDLGAETGDQRDRQAGKGPIALRTALMNLGEAILRGDDDDQIEELQDALAEQREDDGVDLDDTVELTDRARKRAPDVLKLLTASQVAAYISDCADDISDPLKEMLDALDKLRTADNDDFVVLRDQVADDVALALAGLDVGKDARISSEITVWLNKGRSLSASEFKRTRTDLQQEARTLVGEADPLDIVRHYLLRDMAELLANPYLPAAIAGRLRVMKGTE